MLVLPKALLDSNLETINLIMGCVSLVSFVVLINGVASPFFNAL